MSSADVHPFYLYRARLASFSSTLTADPKNASGDLGPYVPPVYRVTIELETDELDYYRLADVLERGSKPIRADVEIRGTDAVDIEYDNEAAK